MRILMSNDDGYSAIGIKTMANALANAGHEILVVAPSENRSGFSHSLSIRKPMRLYSKPNCEGYDERVTVYALEATPADCIKFSCFHFKEFKADMVVSGINDGPNLGIDTMYSGTVGAGMEGINHGIKAIAVSIATYETPVHFDTCARFVVEKIEELYNIDKLVLWNFNCPDLEYDKVKGVMHTRIGRLFYNDCYDKSEVEGTEAYSLGGTPRINKDDHSGTDVGAVFSGYTSITPIMCDRTCYTTLEELK